MLNIGGVPEHFNLPWHRLLESDFQPSSHLQLNWQDYPAGTGAMVSALNSGELDLAMLVTEGAVAASQKPECDFELVSFYTVSPLLWGIHVPANSDIHSVADCQGKRYAISRFGSGSELMARVHARQQGWTLDKNDFVLAENLDGARTALANRQAEVFFWEHFTTKPYVDNGEFRWLEDFPPLWPGFVVCVRKSVQQKYRAEIRRILSAVFAQADTLVTSDSAAEAISERYQLPQADVHQWLATTRWCDQPQLDEGIIARVRNTLEAV